MKERYHGEWKSLDSLASVESITSIILKVRNIAVKHLKLVGINVRAEELIFDNAKLDDIDLKAVALSNEEMDMYCISDQLPSKNSNSTAEEQPITQKSIEEEDKKIDSRAYCSNILKLKNKDIVKLDRLDRFRFKSHQECSDVPMKKITNEIEKRNFLMIGEWILIKKQDVLLHVLEICKKKEIKKLKQQSKVAKRGQKRKAEKTKSLAVKRMKTVRNKINKQRRYFSSFFLIFFTLRKVPLFMCFTVCLRLFMSC